MIGAILARRQARATFARLNAHDLEGFMRAIADDAVFDFPGQTDLSGHHVGKSAVRVYFHTMLDRFPQIRFTLRHVGVENILAVSGTNTLLVEWDLDYTNRAGRTFHNSGVTSAIAKGGKIVRLRDYLFDLVALAAANAPESDAPGSRPAQASESLFSAPQLPQITCVDPLREMWTLPHGARCGQPRGACRHVRCVDHGRPGDPAKITSRRMPLLIPERAKTDGALGT